MSRVKGILQYNLRTIQNLRNIQSSSTKCFDEETIGKSAATILDIVEDERLMVNHISTIGFKLNNNMKVRGPVAIFPKTVLSWHVKTVADINSDSLSLFPLIIPKIELLVIGKGIQEDQVDMKTIRYLRENKITFEILPTEQACSTFNFLVCEGRFVAGAFIPPRSFMYNDDDVVQNKEMDGTLFEPETPYSH